MRIQHGIHGAGQRILLHAPGFALVGHAKLRVHAGEDRVFAQQPRTKAVDGGHPGALQAGADFGVVLECRRQFLAHVARGFFGKRDGENAQRIDVFRHQSAEVLHQHGGLPRAGPGDHAGIQITLGNVAGLFLIRRERQFGERYFAHAPSTRSSDSRISMRQTSRKSQKRQLSGFAGAASTRPSRIYRTTSSVRSLAPSSQFSGSAAPPSSPDALHPAYWMPPLTPMKNMPTGLTPKTLSAAIK